MTRDEMLREYTRYIFEIEKRLDAGRKEYGDKSYSRDPLELVGEIEQEIFDVSGWGFILWMRLRKIRAELERLRDQEAP